MVEFTCVDLKLGIMVLLAVTLAEKTPSWDYGTSVLVYQWASLEFDWPSEAEKSRSLQDGSYVPERNLICGIKVYKDDVYLTVPRWRWNSGQPATLGKVVVVNGTPKLRPYPNWGAQKLGDCSALQYVQSMEIDPNTGLMYVIDTGRTGIVGNVTPNNLCPAKLVVYDLKNDSMVDTYEFPNSVVSRTNNFMNDIVLDYVDNQVRFAYITDPNEAKLYCVDLLERTSYAVQDESMKAESGNATTIEIYGKNYEFNVAIDGIAMSKDFDYVYYCPLGGYKLYQIPTRRLRDKSIANSPNKSSDIRLVGRKVSQSDGMAYSSGGRLYFGALGLNDLYSWNIRQDEMNQGVGEDRVKMENQAAVVVDNIKNKENMEWIDTFAFDDDGWLWFVSNRIHLFQSNTMDFSGDHGSNMRVSRVYVGEASYLHGAGGISAGSKHTKSNPTLIVVILGSVVALIINIMI